MTKFDELVDFLSETYSIPKDIFDININGHQFNREEDGTKIYNEKALNNRYFNHYHYKVREAEWECTSLRFPKSEFERIYSDINKFIGLRENILSNGDKQYFFEENNLVVFAMDNINTYSVIEISRPCLKDVE